MNHHRILIDALEEICTPPGRRLATMIRHHRRDAWWGCRDPDHRFRDYHNHVVHVSEGYWGGAPRLAHRWFERLVDELVRRRYREAGRSAGTLVHYVTDPLHPLHTAQCDRSLAQQWAIKRIGVLHHDRWVRRWRRDNHRIEIRLSRSSAWLGEAVLHGARRAHRHYGTLLHDVDAEALAAGAKRGSADGFGSRFEAAHAEMIGTAMVLVARVLERAAERAERVGGRPIGRPPVVPDWRRWGFAGWDRWVQAMDDRRMRRWAETPRGWPPVDVVRRVIEVHRREQRWREAKAEQSVASREPITLRIVRPPDDGETAEIRRPRAA